MGINFDIESNRRIKHYYMRCNCNGYITFCFPSYAKNHTDFIQDFIQKNYSKIQNMLDNIERNNGYVREYITNYPNKLNIFNEWHDTCDLSIKSLSSMLYDRVLLIMNEYSKAMKLSFSGLSISYANSYLGQCKHEHIKIDYRNILSSDDCLHYLVVHELSHIRHRNHSSRFWDEVAKYCPNCKQIDKKLKLSVDNNAKILKYYGLLPHTYKKYF